MSQRDAGRGSHLPRDGSQLRTLPCGPGFREARACGERGHLPGRAVPLPRGAILPSTLKTAQKEVWTTKVNTEPHGPPTGFPLSAVLSHTVSRGAQECGTLSSPGVFSLPFPRFKSHSLLRLAHNYLIVPRLLENHIRPRPPPLLGDGRLAPHGAVWPGVVTAGACPPMCPRCAPPEPPECLEG